MAWRTNGKRQVDAHIYHLHIWFSGISVGEERRGPSSPLIFLRQSPPPLSQGLHDWATPYLKVWICHCGYTFLHLQWFHLMTNSFIQPPYYYDHILFLAKCTSWKILCFIFLMTCFLWPPPYWPKSGHIITRFQCTLYWIIFSLVRQLHREFLRAGSDVIQAFTFTLDDDLGGEHAKHGVGIILSFNFF